MPRLATTARTSGDKLGVAIATSGYRAPTDCRHSCRTRTPGRYAGAVSRVTYAALWEDMAQEGYGQNSVPIRTPSYTLTQDKPARDGKMAGSTIESGRGTIPAGTGIVCIDHGYSHTHRSVSAVMGRRHTSTHTQWTVVSRQVVMSDSRGSESSMGRRRSTPRTLHRSTWTLIVRVFRSFTGRLRFCEAFEIIQEPIGHDGLESAHTRL